MSYNEDPRLGPKEEWILSFGSRIHRRFWVAGRTTKDLDHGTDPEDWSVVDGERRKVGNEVWVEESLRVDGFKGRQTDR